MALQTGVQLGGYEILSLVGAGGMGEVYCAQDHKLGREVAIKVLPTELASHKERLARFEREARILASLNHPNIATLHGFEADGDTRFLVMELVEGEDLAARLKRGPMPIEEAVPLFLQIAHGLESAHAKDIVHRDLKPANLKITPDGRIKILDFGLAKAAESAFRPESAEADSPTVTYSATLEGTILGTAAYMAPEQAKGQPIDKRADIWAFGACLYEALTGSRAFVGEDAADTLAAVLQGEIGIDRLPSATPPPLERLLRRCLTRDREQRLHDLGDARLELHDAADFVPHHEAEPSRSSGEGLRTLMMVALLTAIVTAAAAFLLLRRSEAPPASSTLSVISAPPSASPFVADFLGATDIAITPDGNQVVYLYLSQAGYHNLYLRPIDRLAGRALTDDYGYYGPFVSPDGRWVGFSHSGNLEKMSIEGGPRTIVCQPGQVQGGASWGSDGWIFFAGGSAVDPGLYRVPDTGGEPELLVAVDQSAGEQRYSTPEVLPGGHAVLFTVRFADSSAIAVIDLSSRVTTTLIEDGSRPRYDGAGKLLYGVGESIYAVRFDPRRLQISGEPVEIAAGVVLEHFTDAPNFAVSHTGRLVYLTNETDLAPTRRRLVWIDRDGRSEPLEAPSRHYTQVRIAPDGRSVVAQIMDDGSDLWLIDVLRGTSAPLATHQALDWWPLFRPDGRSLVFERREGVGARLFEVATSGGSAPELISDQAVMTPYAITPDGETLVHRRMALSDDIWVYSFGNNETRPLLVSDADERNADLSPDGRWLVYESNETGAFEIYARPFPNVEDQRISISKAGGRNALWSKDGSELFYIGPGGLHEVDIEITSDGLRVGTPELLLERSFPSSGRPYDVTRDGQRFLVIEQQSDQPEGRGVDVVLLDNWKVDVDA